MELNRINESERARHLGTSTPWDTASGISPEELNAGLARGRQLHGQAIRDAFGAAGRALRWVVANVRGKVRDIELGRLTHRVVPRVPAGAHGPEAVDFDCVHGRPC